MAKKQIKGEAAFDAFVELIDPILDVAHDEELIALWESKPSMLHWLCEAIKRHKETFMQTLTLLTGQDAETMTFLDIYNGMNQLLGEYGLMALFIPKSQKKKATSGSVSETTEAPEK